MPLPSFLLVPVFYMLDSVSELRAISLEQVYQLGDLIRHFKNLAGYDFLSCSQAGKLALQKLDLLSVRFRLRLFCWDQIFKVVARLLGILVGQLLFLQFFANRLNLSCVVFRQSLVLSTWKLDLALHQLVFLLNLCFPKIGAAQTLYFGVKQTRVKVYQAAIHEFGLTPVAYTMHCRILSRDLLRAFLAYGLSTFLAIVHTVAEEIFEGAECRAAIIALITFL